jgi:hypothetical protein
VHKEKAGAFCNTSASFSNVGKESQPLFFTAKKVREGLECASHAGTTITFSHSLFIKGSKKKLSLFAGSAPSITRSLHKNLTAKGRKEGAKECHKSVIGIRVFNVYFSPQRKQGRAGMIEPRGNRNRLFPTRPFSRTRRKS